MVQAEGEWLKPPHRVLLSLQQSKAIASALLSARMPSLLVKGKAEGVGGWGTIARRCFSMGRSIAPENTIKPIGRTAPVLVLKASPPRRLLGYRERVAARGGGRGGGRVYGPPSVCIRGSLPTPEVSCNDRNNCFDRSCGELGGPGESERCSSTTG